MSASIECYVYASAEASMAEAYTLSVTEPGPTVVDVTLTQPLRFTDALTEWQTQLNASALAGTYTIAWAAVSQSVVISATGVASFAVEFGGNLHKLCGFSSATGHTGALTYRGDQQALGRFDDLRWSVAGVVPHDDVTLHEYRHGRARAIAWSQVDAIEGSLYCTRERMDFLLVSYCAAGIVRVYPDEDVSTAYSTTQTDGYIDGMVLAIDDPEHRPARGLSRVRLAIGLGR